MTEPQRWPDTIDRIRRHLGLQLGGISVLTLPRGEPVIQAFTNIPQRYVEAFTGFDSSEIVAVWGGASRLAELPLEEPMVHTECVEPEIWIGMRYYEEWSVPQGLVDQIAVKLEHNSAMLGTISFGLHKSMPPINSAQVEVMRVLAPHLRRAVNLSRLFDVNAAAATTFASVIDASASGIFLVDRHLGLVHLNVAGQNMVQAHDPIRVDNHHVTLINEVIPGQLAETVSDAAVDEAGLGRRAAGIPARRRDGTPIVVHVMPLERRPSGLGLPQRAIAAIVVPNEAAERPSPMDAAAILYSLRPAEVRVFELIAAGRTNVEIAKALGVARSTVKTHALRLFAKLGRSRRSDLIQLVHELSLRF